MSVVTLIGFQQLAEGMEQQKQDMGVALDEFMHAMQDEADTALHVGCGALGAAGRAGVLLGRLKQANGVFESVGSEACRRFPAIRSRSGGHGLDHLPLRFR